MEKVNIHEAKTRLSELLQRVEAGEEFVIARAGLPIARLSKIQRTERKPGYLGPEFRLAQDFFDADEEIVEMFEESEVFPA